MGEYADYQIELDDAEFARQSAADYEKSRPKVICKICQRHIKPSGLKDHMRDKHAATPQPVIAPWVMLTDEAIEAALKAACMHSTPESRKDMRRAINTAIGISK